MFLNLYAVQALLPTFADAFAVPLARTGWTITAPLLAIALLAPFVGSVSDMLGRKRIIVAAMAALPLPTLLVAFAASLPILIAWRFVQGLTMPFIFAVTVAYVGEETEGGDTIRLAGTYTVGTIFGGFMGRFVAGHVTQLAGWRATFILFAALTALFAVAVAVLLPTERRFRPIAGIGASLRSFGDHLTNRRLLATFAVGFSMLFCIIAVFTYVNFYLAEPPFGLGPAALGNVFVVYLLGMVMTPVATRLAVHFGRRATLGLATAVCIAALALTLVKSLVGHHCGSRPDRRRAVRADGACHRLHRQRRAPCQVHRRRALRRLLLRRWRAGRHPAGGPVACGGLAWLRRARHDRPARGGRDRHAFLARRACARAGAIRGSRARLAARDRPGHTGVTQARDKQLRRKRSRPCQPIQRRIASTA